MKTSERIANALERIANSLEHLHIESIDHAHIDRIEFSIKLLGSAINSQVGTSDSIHK